MAAILLALFSNSAFAASSEEEDTDTRFIDAKVVEVNDTRISVMTRTGVEHVIAIDGKDTRVRIAGKLVSLKDVREGDVVTVDLDEQNPLKFARNIVIAAQSDSAVAKARP
jgi:translation initiation factor IF-1